MSASVVERKEKKARSDEGIDDVHVVAKARRENRKSEPRSIETIRAELKAAEAKIDRYAWGRDETSKSHQKAAALRTELELAELAALPEASADVPVPVVFVVSIDKIAVAGNHREPSPAEASEIQRLARSLETVGLQQPIGVRQLRGGPVEDAAVELIWGSRRLAAAIAAGWTDIPALVYPPQTTAAQVELLRTVENSQRKDLTPVERAIAVARTIQSVMESALPGTTEGARVAKAVNDAGGLETYVGLLLGYPAAWVRDHAYVAKLGGRARELLAERRISLEHARELAKLGDEKKCDRFAEDVAKNADGTGGKSVVYLRQQIEDSLLSLKSVPWRLDVKFLKQGDCLPVACESCKFNSKADPQLFEHDQAEEGEDVAGLSAAGVCRYTPCFEARKAIAQAEIEAGLKKVQAAAAKVAKSKDADPIPLTEKGLASLTPAVVRGSTFARKAKATIEPKETQKSEGAAQNGKKGEQKSPEEAAYDRYCKAFDTWQAAAAAKLLPKLNADPMRVAYVRLLNESESLRDLDVQLPQLWGSPVEKAKKIKSNLEDYEKARRMAATGKHRSMLKCLAAPTPADFAVVAEDFGKLQAWALRDLVDTALLTIAESLGVELDPPPTYAAPGEAKPAEPAKGKPAKKAGKKSPAAPAADDDEQLEDEE